MTKTYAQLQKQIKKLQQEADAARAKEVAGVVSRIKEAINHYGLTVADLFPPNAARKERTLRSSAKSGAKAPKKQLAPPKYSDGSGKTWNGIGKRPGWFVAALTAGKTATDLEIAPSRT